MMAIDLSFAKLAALPRRLKIVVLVILLDLLLIAAAAFVDSGDLGEQAARVGQLRGQVAQLRRQGGELRSQIARYSDLLDVYNRAVAAGLLQRPDGTRLVSAITGYAGQCHLVDLHYRLEAEDVTKDPKARYQPSVTVVSLESGATLDSDVMTFWDDVLDSLPAHYRVNEATIERTRSLTPSVLADLRAGRPVSLVNARLSLRWSSLQKTEEGK
jgi:hypothetical protein